MIKLIVSTTLLIVFCACNAQNESKIFIFENKVNVELDSISLDKNELLKINNFRFPCITANYHINSDSSISLLYLKGDSQIIDFNITTSNIDIIEVGSTKKINLGFLSLIKINNAYALLNEISELYIHNFDTLSNQNCQLDTLENFKNSKIWLTADMGFGFRLPFVGDSCIMIVVGDDLPGKSKSINTFAKVNIYTKEAVFYKLPRRKEFFNNYHHLRQGIKMETLGDTLFVNYQFSEKIDLYSLNSGKFIGSKILKSKYQHKPIPHLSSFKNDFDNDRYAIEADYYDGLTYNPYKKCYYRFYYHTLPRKNENDEYTISKDKVVSLAIFDQNFNWIGEQIVNWKSCYAGVVPHPEGALSFFGSHQGDNYYLGLVKHD